MRAAASVLSAPPRGAPITRRDKLVVIALVVLLAAASAGAIVVDRSQGPAPPAFGGTYIEGVVGVPRLLNPLLAATTVDEDVARLAFSGLTRYDRSGSIVPDLASSFRVSEDGRLWTFEIRPDAVWHDGTEVSAADVVYTVGLVQDQAYVGPFADAFRGVAAVAVGPKTVRFTLPEAHAPFAASTSLPLLPAQLLGGVRYVELAKHPFNQRPVGTGPFKVTAIDARQITLSRHDGFYRTRPERDRPYLDRIVLRSYREGSEALAALARGEIDGIAGLSALDAERARSLKDVTLYSLPTNDFTALFLNVRPERPVFRDRAVRQAIGMALDRGKMLQLAADGRGTVADQFVSPSSWAYSREVPRTAHSRADARVLLDAADWRDHDGDGIRDKGGVALRFTISTSDEPARVVVARQIVLDLAAIEMSAEQKIVPFVELVDKVARDRTFDLLLVGITAGSDPDPYAFFHSSQAKDPGYNFSGYSTLPLDRILEATRRTFDVAKRRELYAGVFQQIALETPVIFLYFTDYLYAQRSSVYGLKIAPISDRTQRFWDVEDWYLKVSPRR